MLLSHNATNTHYTLDLANLVDPYYTKWVTMIIKMKIINDYQLILCYFFVWMKLKLPKSINAH